MSLKWSLTLISWIIFLSSIACVSIFIVCWFIWVFSPNPDARKEVIKFKDKTTKSLLTLIIIIYEFLFKVFDKILPIVGVIIFIGIIILIIN
jgi:hypothetical protein